MNPLRKSQGSPVWAPRVSLSFVTFRPDAMRGAIRRGTGVDYRLARRHLVNEYHRGRLSRTDVCDAHPELIRAAKHVGHVTAESCPICEEHPLVHVSYVFGARLPAHGRCITTTAELTKLARQNGEFACYVVEVCPDCRWNHLARMFHLGRKHAG